MKREELQTIGPYRIVALLSKGGMGVVYRARRPDSAVDVALKTVELPRPDLLHSIRREIHALRRLQHPGVVRVLDEGVHNGLPWYAMELLTGSTLRARLDALWPGMSSVHVPSGTTRGATALMPRAKATDAYPAAAPEPARNSGGPCAGGALPEVLTLVRRLCDALSFIHGEGIVHRDLKPENIFLRPDGSPVLVDFGLVSSFGGSDKLQVAGSFAGSVHYVSPEQIDCKLVDARADLYALGCVLYELVTGQPPFLGEAMEVLHKHMTQAPLPSSRLVEGVPHALEDLLTRLLSKQPRDRIGYASDVAAALVELGAEGSDSRALAVRPYLYRPEFTARADVLGELERALDRARTGAGNLAFIAGEAGAGKTRLAMEIASSANRRGFRVVTGECVPVEHPAAEGASRGGPLHPFKPLLQAIVDHCRGHHEAAERILGPRGKLLAAYEPDFASLPGQERHAEPPRLPAQAAQERLISCLVETLSAFIAQDGALLLVLDDLQWADALSLEVLAALRKGPLPKARALVLGTYRSGEEGEVLRVLGESPGVTKLKLGGLDRGAVGSMVRDMLALPEPPDSFIRFLHTQSDGNPLFVAEYLRAAIDEGLLRRNGAGRWQWVADGTGRDLSHEALQLPGAVRELVARRLDGLSLDARFMIEAASVLGREFDGELLGKVACVPDQETLEALEELLRKDVVEETKPGRFRFGQNKLREVTYGAIEPDRRTLFHHAAAEALEARHAGTGSFGLSYPLLAHHWAAAGVTDKTQEYLEKAAERSLRTGANAEAADFFRRALALEGERDEAASRQRRANWERKLGEALYGVGDVAGSKAHLLRAMRLLGWPMPETQGAWTRLLMKQLGKQLLHLALPSRWLAAKDADRDLLATVALTAARLSECYYFNQEMLPTVALSLLAVNLAERTGRGGEILRLYGHLGYLAGLGRLHVLARRYFARAQGEGQALEDPSAVAFGFILESMYHVTFARYGLGADRAQRALEVLQGAWNAKDSAIEKLELGYVPPEVYLAKNLLAHVDFYEGRLPLAQQKLEDVSRLARAQSNTQYEAWTEMDVGRGMIAADQLDEAVHLLEHAHGLLKGKGDKSNELQSQGLLATALLYRGELTRAREVADGVAALMRDVQPSVFTEGCGFEGVALVYLAAWEREGRKSKETAARAWNAVSVLRRFSLLFPLARPAALRLLGKAHLLAGRSRWARSLWRRSVDIAQRLGMPYEAALTLLELGKHSAGEKQRERYLGQARELLERVGRPQQLRELEDGEKSRAAG